MLTFQEMPGFLNSKRGELLNELGRFDLAQQLWTEYDGGWNAAQITEHLVLVELWVLHEVERLLDSAAPRPSEPAEAKLVDIQALFRERGLLGTRKKSPPEVEPTGALPLGEALAELHGVRSRLLACIPQLAVRETNSLTSLHPLGVELNACQWLVFSAFHEWAHLHQLRRIRQAHVPE